MISDRRGAADDPRERAREDLVEALEDEGLSVAEIEQLSPFLDFYADQQYYTLLRNGFVALAILAWLTFPLVRLVGIGLGVLALLVGAAVAMQFRPHRRAERLREQLLEDPEKFLEENHGWDDVVGDG